MDLYSELQEKQNLLNMTISEIKKRGKELAQAEHDYRVALAQKIMLERADGQPVTIISDICRGDEKVANLKLQRDIADSMYTSVLEAVNVLKLNVKIIENQLEREYGQTKRM